MKYLLRMSGVDGMHKKTGNMSQKSVLVSLCVYVCIFMYVYTYDIYKIYICINIYIYISQIYFRFAL